MRNQRRSAALIVLALVAIVATGGLVASNMGFKLTYSLKAAQGGVSKSGTQSIGLPYNRQVGIDKASDLFNEITASVIVVHNIQRFDSKTDQNQVYAAGGGVNFSLNKAEGYLIKVGTSGSYVITGTHDPSFVVQLKAAAPGVSKSGTQRYAHPYHGVAATAGELFQELSPQVQNIQRYDSLADSHQVYTFGSPNFPLVPGQAYLVKVGFDVSFVPAHY